LPNNNDTITPTADAGTTAAVDPSVDAGGVKGLKVVTNTNNENSTQLLQQ